MAAEDRNSHCSSVDPAADFVEVDSAVESVCDYGLGSDFAEYVPPMMDLVVITDMFWKASNELWCACPSTDTASFRNRYTPCSNNLFP